MCVAIPAQIVEKTDFLATVETYGARRQVNLMLLPEDAEIGDYVLVHAGYAIRKIDKQAGEETLELFDEVIRLTDTTDTPDTFDA